MDISKLQENWNEYVSSLKTKDIIKILDILADAYYNTDEPLVEDYIYDKIYEYLKIRDPKNKYFNKVGVDIKKTFEKLPYEMGSLTKLKISDDINRWIKRYNGPYIVSDKLDGVSGQLYKNLDGQINLYTRGNGINGQNISHLIKYLFNDAILDKLPKGISIRGEIIINKENFAGIKDMKNARNAISGLVNAKQYNTSIANKATFVAYSILSPNYFYDEQIKLLQQYGFTTVYNLKLNEIKKETLENILLKRKIDSLYEIDGIVCISNSEIYTQTGGYPDHTFAFKMLTQDQLVETMVLDVLWTPSKDGYINPKIVIEPVDIDGVTISKANAFNASFIEQNNIGKGAKILITRSGGVIPDIYDVILGSKDGPLFPNYPYKWDNNHVNIILTNECNTNGKQIVKIKQLEHYFSTTGVKFLSEGILTKFVDNGYNNLEKILKANKEQLYEINGFGKKLITKIYDEIDKSFETMDLATFMAGSNKLGRGFGVKKISAILEVYPNILNDTFDSKDEFIKKIIAIKGFSDITANQFCSNFDKFKDFYIKISKIKDLKRFESLKVTNINTNKELKFNNYKFVFTGFRNDDIQKYIIENGGSVSNSISSTTNILIHADNMDTTTTKFKMAIKKNITIISKSEFEKKYMS